MIAYSIAHHEQAVELGSLQNNNNNNNRWVQGAKVPRRYNIPVA